MKIHTFILRSFFFITVALTTFLFGDNQTPTTTPIIVDHDLPFRVKIVQAEFSLPNGIQSFASAVHDGKWLFIAGRTNGLHGFNDDNNDFPPSLQNTIVYVVDPEKSRVYMRSLLDAESGLTQTQVDYLSTTSPQFYQKGKTLYITGGYGVDTSTGQFSTKSILTAIHVPGLMDWVMRISHGSAVKYIRQISHPVFQVTGGYMTQIKNNPTLLIFGQNFDGFYSGNSNGTYTRQVRRFDIIDDGKKLKVDIKSAKPSEPDENYRRRDLNVVPIIEEKDGNHEGALVAYSGVFTPSFGIWTVPVFITANGNPSMDDPENPQTFKQGMNNYASPTFGLFSKKKKDMYTVILGGISYGYFQNGQFITDSEFPFINQVTAIKRDKHGQYKQYLLNVEYPVILSTQSNPGNQLLFGAGAQFFPSSGMSLYENGVFKLDNIHEETVIGYIVGGIQSTLPNTNVQSDSAASPYIFKVILEPN